MHTVEWCDCILYVLHVRRRHFMAPALAHITSINFGTMQMTWEKLCTHDLHDVCIRFTRTNINLYTNCDCSQSSFVLNLFLAFVHDARLRARERERERKSENVMLIYFFLCIMSDSNKAVRSAFDIFSDVFFAVFMQAIFIGNKVQLCAKTVSFSNNGNHYAVVPCSQPHVQWVLSSYCGVFFRVKSVYGLLHGVQLCWLLTAAYGNCAHQKNIVKHIFSD